MEEKTMTPGDIIAIVKRRKWSLIISFLVVLLITGIVALALPSVYKASSTILIEEQEIPKDFVMTAVTSFAEQRIQSINQRIMSHAKLLKIIEEYKLYPKLRAKWTEEEVVEEMRNMINLEPISVDVIDHRTGRPATATIAFSLSYEGEDARTVHKVANVLVSLYLEEDIKVRTENAADTSAFLENEYKKIKELLSEKEKILAAFKEQFAEVLPELLQVNMQGLNSAEMNIVRLTEVLRGLKERAANFEAQLAGIPETSENTDWLKLDQLKLQLADLKSKYSNEYPDVITVKNEIIELEKMINQPDNSTVLGKKRPDTQAQISLVSQLENTKVEIESTVEQLNKYNLLVEDYRKRIALSPKVGVEYKALSIERDNTQLKYNDLMMKHMEAKVAEGMQSEQKGERFVLIEAPRLPEKPFKPNRIAIFLIGIVLGIGAGVGVAALTEFSDTSVRRVEDLTFATSFPVLAGIPVIINKKDIIKKRRNRVITVISILLVIISAIAIFHFFVMDLDVFWAKVMRKADRTLMPK